MFKLLKPYPDQAATTTCFVFRTKTTTWLCSLSQLTVTHNKAKADAEIAAAALVKAAEMAAAAAVPMVAVTAVAQPTPMARHPPPFSYIATDS